MCCACSVNRRRNNDLRFRLSNLTCLSLLCTDLTVWKWRGGWLARRSRFFVLLVQRRRDANDQLHSPNRRCSFTLATDRPTCKNFWWSSGSMASDPAGVSTKLLNNFEDILRHPCTLGV